MAPRNRPSSADPSRIDVDLNLIGGDSLAAVEALTRQLSAVTAHLAAAGEADPAVAEALRAQAMQQQTWAPGTVSSGGSHASRGTASPPVTDGAGQAASMGDPEIAGLANVGLLGRLRHYLSEGRPQGGILNREMEIHAFQETTQYQRRRSMGLVPDMSGYGMHAPSGYDMDSPVSSAGGGGGPSAGASVPVGADMSAGADPTWLRALKADPRAFERAQEPFTLPQFGALTPQDKLNFFGDALARSATAARARAEDRAAPEIRRAVEGGMSREEAVANLVGDAGQGRGSMSFLLHQSAGLASQAIIAGAEVNRIQNWGTGVSQAGVQAGAERGPAITIPGTHIGINLPGSAFLTGLRGRIGAAELAATPGVTRGQAMEIMEGVRLSGFGDPDEQRRIAFDAVAPGVRQGIDPAIMNSLASQALRNGTTSIQEFNDTMQELGPAARAANQTLDEFAQGIEQFAEQASQRGATAGRGQRLGVNVASSLGMEPQVAGELMFNNPLVEGFGMTQGFLPNEMGLMSARGGVDAIYGALNMARQATSGFRDQPIRDRSGRIIASGRERQIAQMATIMNTTPDRIRRLERASGAARTAATANDRLDRWVNQSRAVDRVRENAPRGEEDVLEQIRSKGERGQAKPTGARLHSAEAALDRNWRGIRDQLVGLAPEGREERGKYYERIQELESKQGRDRANEARKMISERMDKYGALADDRPQVKVEFTGRAKAFFRQADQGNTRDRAKRDSDAGGKGINTKMLRPDATPADYRNWVNENPDG